MPDKLVTRGLVLRATETKEADYILTVLTAEHGRLAVIARGARRRTSKLAAACQHLAFSELVLYRRGSWYYLDEASTIALFDGLRADLEKLSLASCFAEMAEAVTSEDLPSGEVLSLLLNSLYALDTLDRPNEMVRAAFELRLLAHEGQDLAVGARLDAAGIDEREFAAAPLAFAVNAVAGHAGRVLHDGQAAAAELIEEHGLADVRPAHDRNQGSGHDYPSLWGLYL